MGEAGKTEETWREYLTPFKLVLLAVSWISFCICLVLLAMGNAAGALLILLLALSGICSIGGLVRTIIMVKRRHSAH